MEELKIVKLMNDRLMDDDDRGEKKTGWREMGVDENLSGDKGR